MNIVDPIRDEAMLRRVKEEARKMGLQQYLLVLIGVNTGLRVSDILKLRVSDFRKRGYVVRREQKTGKHTEIQLHPAVVAEVNRLVSDWEDERLLFKTKRADNKDPWIDRNTAYDWVRKCCRRAGYRGPVGCHTLRRTYGYHFYQKTHDLATLMLHFNHSSEKITLRYIGVTQEMINRKTRAFRL